MPRVLTENEKAMLNAIALGKFAIGDGGCTGGNTRTINSLRRKGMIEWGRKLTDLGKRNVTVPSNV